MSRFDVAIKIFMIVCFVLLLWIACASAATLVVSQKLPACTSGDEYFTSVQAAVDRAKGGDEIIVCPGTYVENIEVDKSVDILSYAGSRNTIIEAKNIDDNVINIIANKVNVSGFTIRKSEANGIALFADCCNISGNNIYSTRNGIHLCFGYNNIISYNTVNLNSYIGIILDDSNDNLISKNSAKSNKQSHGIQLDSSNNNVIIGNNASNNSVSGIALFGSNTNTIRENRANSNKQSHGIQLDSSNNNVIIGNNASNNSVVGIGLFGSNTNTIRGNRANSNKQGHGIQLNSSNNNDIIDNNASNNSVVGIGLFGSNTNTIRGNTANSNKQAHGILLDSSNNNDIRDNNASNNFHIGIALLSSSNNTIRGNTANSNKQSHGIYLNSSNNNDMIDNNASYNFQAGIILFISNNNTIRENRANSNKQGHGIQLSSSSNNKVIDNNASNNFDIGIGLFDSNNNTIRENNVKSNKRGNGISVVSSNNNVIINNTASNNFDAGISLSDSNNNTIRENNVKSNKQGNGITVVSSNNNVLSNNILIYNDRGISTSSSNDNTITSNIVYSNEYGIYLGGSQKNNISNNIINSNIDYGIAISSSENNNIVNNIINSNQGCGLVCQSSRETNVLNNFIDSNGEQGIALAFLSTITISGNTISSNYREGIYIDDSYNFNKIYHNNIINNKVRDDTIKGLEGLNKWYNKSLEEGSYWSDYNGTDDGSGTDKHAIAGDDIGDTNIPYPEEGYDFYPFMNRDGWLTMSVWHHYLDFRKVYQGTLVNQTFNITNYGNTILNVTSIKSDPEIAITGIELPAVIPKGHSKSFNITLDTEDLDGFILKNIEVVSNDRENPHKAIAIFGFVEIPARNIIISGFDYQSRVIKGQINLFNVTIENHGDFREKNVSIEIKERENIWDNTTIKNIESRENRSAILKWNTENASMGIHEIKIEVLSKDKEPLTNLAVKVSVLAPSKAKTLIVTNLERLDEVENDLIRLSYHPSVNGLILNVANDQKCSEAYNSWDSHPNSENANDVASAIKDLIDSSLAIYKNIEYLLIVGNDEVIPFYRIQDKSLESYVGSYGLYDEKDYIERYEQLEPTTIGSAFQDNMYLTDDFYANFESEDLPEGFDGELYIPEKPVGRLVETPEEISKTIDVFSKRGDIVEPNRIFITSYDFMNDAGGSCASVWRDLSTPTFMGKGIEEHGTYSDTSEIINELLNESNNIIAIFQHADHYEFDIAESHDFVTSNIISNSSADLDGSIVYTMSCHAGLNVPEDEKFNYDLAQAFMGKGVLAYVAPTGWGIGGVVTEAGHERLMHYFTKHLCEGMDAGTALMHAKQDYYAFDFDFDYIDQKVVLTSVLYGLPMYGVNAEAKTEGLMKAMSMEKPCNTFTFRPDYSEIETPVGNYSLADETLSAPGKPVLPKLIWPYTMDRKMLHGITLKNARYALLENTALPYEEYVVSIAGGYKQPLLTGETWNPSEFFKVSTIGKRQYIILITGQFKKTGFIDKKVNNKITRINIGDLRRYTELTFDLYLSSPKDEKEPPKIEVSTINTSFIKVKATDESGMRKIVVAYTDNTGNWESFDIVPDVAACTLEEEIELEVGKEYLVQVVDIYGNVAVDDNDGAYYLEKGGSHGR